MIKMDVKRWRTKVEENGRGYVRWRWFFKNCKGTEEESEEVVFH
jgi:hypothetical protein